MIESAGSEKVRSVSPSRGEVSLVQDETFETQLNGPRNNCLILGAGRSGTSVTGSLLVHAGYHGFSQTFPKDEGNPLGNFEDVDIVEANEGMLAPLWRSPRFIFSRALRRKPYLGPMGAWLLDLKPRELASISLRPHEAERFTRLFACTPFAYKDPRFSFTLAALVPVIPKNTRYLCVFRDPLQVMESTRRKALQIGIEVSNDYCFSVWEAHYRCILEHHRKIGGEWLFINYQHLIDRTAVPRLEDLLQVRLDRNLVKPELNRTKANGRLPDSVSAMLGILEQLSNS